VTFVDNDQGVIELAGSWIPGEGSSGGGIGAQAAGSLTSLSGSVPGDAHSGSGAGLYGTQSDRDAGRGEGSSGADGAALSVQCERRIERDGLLEVSEAGIRLPPGLSPRTLDVCRAGAGK
jgi:hypothetical protein